MLAHINRRKYRRSHDWGLDWGGDASQLFPMLTEFSPKLMYLETFISSLAKSDAIEGAEVEVVATYGIDDVVANNRLLECLFFERKHGDTVSENNTYYVGTASYVAGHTGVELKIASVRSLTGSIYSVVGQYVATSGPRPNLQSRASNDITGNVSAGLDIGAWPGDVAPPFSAYLPLVNYTDHNPILSIEF